MSRRASWSSKPVAGRVAGRGGFDSHPLPLDPAKECHCERPQGAWQSDLTIELDCHVASLIAITMLIF